MDVEFEHVFAQEYDVMVRTAYVIVGSSETANDVTQEAFARMLARWPRIRRYDSPGAWVRRVTIRLAVKAKTRGATESELTEHHYGSPVADDPSSTLDLRAAIVQLPRQERAAVVLFYLHDLPVATVADVMNLRPGTIRAHLDHARRHLGRILSEEKTHVNR